MLLFFVICLVLCLIPSAGMLIRPTTETTENRAMAQMPVFLQENGSINRSFFDEFEAYYTDHAAFRNEMVYADAMVQTNVFRESNVSGVIYGTDGWLYYTSTLPDYLGTDVLSQRELFGLANNFALVQAYLEEQNIEFVLTIPPNKNTLYGDNMPYYDDYIVNADHSAVLLSPLLKEEDVEYLDLFTMFQNEDETLYLRRDSHWNMKGACLAYNGIMDALQLEHEDYTDVEVTPVANTQGDLNRMLYSFYGVSEEDYAYDMAQNFTYTNEVQSVEDGWIITENEEGEGSLLMFRDSFANTLIPFISNEFETVYYSKGQPNALEQYVAEYNPDYVVIQKVERNIAEYLNEPPIITLPEAEVPMAFTIAAHADASVKIESCMYDVNYYTISGTVEQNRLQTESRIIVSVGDDTYHAYLTEEQGFLLYLPVKELKGNSADIKVYVVDPDQCVRVFSGEVELPQ